MQEKIIAHKTTRAGLSDILDDAGMINVQGESVQKLDLFANQVMCKLHDHIGCLAMMGSEENESIIPIPETFHVGNYILLFDPLDGSSNIEFNVSCRNHFYNFQTKTRRKKTWEIRRCFARCHRYYCSRLHHLWIKHHDGI